MNVLFEEPVVPIMLCSLTVIFILHENDFGLEIARLCCLFNLQINIVMPLVLLSETEISENIQRTRENLFPVAIYVSYYCVFKICIYRQYDVLLVYVRAEEHGEHMIFKAEFFR